MCLDHHERDPRRARTYAAGTLRRYQRPRHRTARRRRVDQEPRKAHPRGNGIARLDRRRSALQRGAGHGQNALGLQAAEKDFDRVEAMVAPGIRIIPDPFSDAPPELWIFLQIFFLLAAFLSGWIVFNTSRAMNW